MGATAHVWIDENDIVRENGKYIGEGKQLFRTMVSQDFSDCSRVIVTDRDKEWDVTTRLDSIGEVISTTAPHAPVFLFESEKELNKTEADRRREAQQKVEAERLANEERIAYLNRPTVDPSLDILQLVQPHFVKKQRRQQGDRGFNDFLQFRKSKPGIRGLDPQQVYLPGEQREQASRYSRGNLVATQKNKTVLKKIVVWSLFIVGIFVAVFVGKTLQATTYSEVCYDTRTQFVLNPSQCLEGEAYSERAWVLSQDGSSQIVGQPLVSAVLEKPQGNVSITPLENSQKKASQDN